MFQDLDASLQALLRDRWIPNGFAELGNADISFETPDRTYAPSQMTLNLFLYEVKENRELRENEMRSRSDPASGFKLRRPPLRLDCAYVATAWSTRNAGAKIAEEHELLGQAMQWLSQFGAIPGPHLVGSLLDALNEDEIPTLLHVAQTDPNRDAGDFWMAMGIAPRAAFYVMATIPMEVGVELDVPIVTTVIAHYPDPDGSGPPRELININGFVFAPNGDPLRQAQVHIEPATAGPASFTPDEATVTTDGAGRFTFRRLRRGVDYTVTAGKAGVGQASRQLQVPSLSGEYNVRIP
jgi:uncharacterized protein DUF4255/carboxypeptidase family protein